MKRLLMIIPFFPPIAGGGVYRPLSFVKYLGGFGWQTTVIAPRGEAFWIRDERLLSQIPDECTVIRTDTLSGQAVMAKMRHNAAPQKRSTRGFSVVRKLAAGVLVPDTYVGWYPYALRAARRALATEPFDAIYSTSPPETSHLVGLKLHQISGLPWVADFRDPWMNLHLLKPPTPVHTALHRKLERRVCEHAHVVVTTEWQEKFLGDCYPRIKSLTRIPNGFDGDEMASVGALQPPDDRFRLVHAGMLTQNRTAVPFLRGFARFVGNRPGMLGKTEVVFVGPREDKNETAVRDLGLEGFVEFRDSLPHEETLRLEKRAHILLLIKHVNPDYAGLVPGKLYEYIGLRRPILALVPEGEAKRRIERLNRGEVVSQDDEEAIAAKIAVLFDRHLNGELETSYDLSPRPELDRAVLAGDLAELLTGLSDACDK